MDTKTILGLAVALLVVLGGAWYFSQQGAGSGETADTNGQMQTGSGSLADLMQFGSSVMCTVSSEDPNAVSEGKVYVAGGKVRGDFTSMVSGQSVESHMVQADGYIYTWSSAMPQGVKMAASATTEDASSAPEGTVNPNATYTYSCSPWSEDAGMFMPPSDVTFMDFSAGMPTIPEGYLP